MIAHSESRPWRSRIVPQLRYRMERFDQADRLHPVRLVRMAAARRAAEQYFKATPQRRALLQALAKSGSTGASLVDYHLLHAYTLQRGPKRILELGSGATTLVMAQALAERKRDIDQSPRLLFSMEDVRSYHEDVKRILPDHLRCFVVLVLSEKRQSRWRDQIWGFHYAELPEEPFDFVFVDGPTETKNGVKGACLDLLYLLERDRDVTIDVIVDRKFSSLDAFQSVLPDRFVSYDPVTDTGALAQVRGSMLLPHVRPRARLRRAYTWKVFALSH